jgi:hypothetical protein
MTCGGGGGGRRRAGAGTPSRSESKSAEKLWPSALGVRQEQKRGSPRSPVRDEHGAPGRPRPLHRQDRRAGEGEACGVRAPRARANPRARRNCGHPPESCTKRREKQAKREASEERSKRREKQAKREASEERSKRREISLYASRPFAGAKGKKKSACSVRSRKIIRDAQNANDVRGERRAVMSELKLRPLMRQRGHEQRSAKPSGVQNAHLP